ncbi:Sulfite exporter TauE/SafE [Gracilaria domingensis]|nr:Sulfite exporter TauE/SafE [Gracilaria domingensis]
MSSIRHSTPPAFAFTIHVAQGLTLDRSRLSKPCPRKPPFSLKQSIRAAVPTNQKQRPGREARYPSLSLPTAFFFALVASSLGALVGAGGGMFLTPLLVSRRVSQRQAHGTSMLMICAVSLISSVKYLTAASANVPAAALLALPALFTAPIGASLTASLQMKNLRRAFGSFLLLVSVSIPLLPRILTTGLSLSTWWLLPVGACTGLISGLLGVGGGSINVPTLVLVGFAQRMAQGTALLAMILPSIRACFTHMRLGNVLTNLFIPLLCGALLGGAFGASVAVMLPETTLRIVCSIFLLFLSFRFLSA